MSGLTVYTDRHAGSTVVSNLFIDEYMKDANDAQLKIYLYLLRMMHARQGTSVSDIADRFNHTEKDVLRALQYWEKRGILELDYDSSRNLSGIHVHDPGQASRREESCDSRPAQNQVQGPWTRMTGTGQPLSQSCSVSGDQSEDTAQTHFQTEEKESRTGKAASQVLPEAFCYEKPTYSADQLQAFKNRQDTAQLLFIAESYIGKPLTASEMKAILYFTDVLHFSDDLIDYLIQYCVDRGKKDFKYIEKVALNWAQEGITSPGDAQKHASRYDRNVYTIMNGLGKSSSPTTREMEYILRWTKDYAFTTDIIIEACERTVLATDKHRFEYADGILSSWKRQNVHHKSDIAKADQMHQQKKKGTSGQPQAKQGANRFNQFTQNQYDFALLEQELISN